METIKVKCPWCHGEGTIEKSSFSDKDKAYIHTRREMGDSLRAIGDKLGVHHEYIRIELKRGKAIDKI